MSPFQALPTGRGWKLSGSIQYATTSVNEHVIRRSYTSYKTCSRYVAGKPHALRASHSDVLAARRLGGPEELTTKQLGQPSSQESPRASGSQTKTRTPIISGRARIQWEHVARPHGWRQGPGVFAHRRVHLLLRWPHGKARGVKIRRLIGFVPSWSQSLQAVKRTATVPAAPPPPHPFVELLHRG